MTDPAGIAQVSPAVCPSGCPSVRAPYRLQWEAAQSAWVLLYPEGMVKLSASAGEILRRCQGRLTVAALITELEEAFQAPQIREDVLAFLALAARQGWVHLRDEAGPAPC